VVTGASRGIGGAIASALAGKGARVVLLARNESRLKEAAKRLKESIPITCDGIFGVSLVEETTTDVFVDTINTNLVGPFVFVRTFLAEMKKRRSGHIVTIGSIADRSIFTGNAAYSAAKFGLRALHEVLRAELRESGVRASLISPAATDTEIWDTVTVTDPAGKPHSKRPMLDRNDVVAAVIFAVTQPDRVNIDELRLSHS